MTSKERAALRAKANGLEPIIQLGKEGISENLLTQIDDTLDTRELIKIRVHLESAPETPKELAQKLADPLGAEVIHEERIAEKKKKRGSGTAKATAKKKVKIKGKRQRQREKEAKNPYAKYDRPKYYGR